MRDNLLTGYAAFHHLNAQMNTIRKRRVKNLALLTAALAVVKLGAVEYVRLAADMSAMPAEQAFVGELVETRVRERVPEPAAGDVFTVTFVPDAAVAADTAIVRVTGAAAEIRAAKVPALLAGAGRLLKSFRYGRGSFVTTDGAYDFSAAKSIRTAYLARHYINPFMQFDAATLCRYLDDLVLDGVNSFDMQLDIPQIDAVRLKGDPAEQARYLDASAAIVRHLKELDCGMRGGGGSNTARGDAPEEFRAQPVRNPRAPNGGFRVCPAKPGAMDFLLGNHAKGLARMRDRGLDIRFVTHFPYDEGGCGCDTCHPWGCNGYVKMCETYHGMNVKAYPGVKTVMSTWFFEDKEYAGLWEYLKTHDWIDYLEIDDFGSDFPKYPLKHPIPNAHTKILTFPEISMWGRIPWGGYGAAAYPKMLERIFRNCEKAVEGFRYYSEGTFEDINKAVVTGLYVDPATTADEILATYAAYHFPGVDTADFVRLVALFETNHRPHMMEFANADAAKRLALKMDREILPPMRTSWRWRLVYLRAMIDAEICGTDDFQPETAKPYFDELVKLYCADRQLERVLEGRMAGWTCPRYCPDGKTWKHHLPPAGDATDALQMIVDDEAFISVRLAKGDWHVRALALKRSRFELVLEDGCRLVGEGGGALMIAKTDGVTLRGEGKAEILMPVEVRDATNVIIRNVTLGRDGIRTVGCEDVLIDLGKKEGEKAYNLHAELKRLDAAVEWAEEHLEHEKTERLDRKLQKLRVLNRAR